MKALRLVLVFCLLTMLGGLLADDLEETLQHLSESGGKAYVSPIVNAFGADFNAGWFGRAPDAKLLGIDVSFKIIAMGAFLSDEDQTFSSEGSFHFNEAQADSIIGYVDWSQYPEDVREELKADLKDQLLAKEFTVGMAGPTITGSQDESVMVTLYGQNFTAEVDDIPYTIPVDDISVDTEVGGLMDIDMLPLFTPQLTLGTIQGTNVKIRFLPNYSIPDLGEFSYFGIGVLHNPTVWMNPLLKVVIPVNLSISFATQSIKVGDVLTASSWNLGLGVSKKLGLKFLNITPYAGIYTEQSRLKFEYDYQYDIVADDGATITTYDDKVDFTLRSDVTSRIVLGAAVRLGVFDLNFDYNIASTNAISAGFGLGFTF